MLSFKINPQTFRRHDVLVDKAALPLPPCPVLVEQAAYVSLCGAQMWATPWGTWMLSAGQQGMTLVSESPFLSSHVLFPKYLLWPLRSMWKSLCKQSRLVPWLWLKIGLMEGIVWSGTPSTARGDPKLWFIVMSFSSVVYRPLSLKSELNMSY